MLKEMLRINRKLRTKNTYNNYRKLETKLQYKLKIKIKSLVRNLRLNKTIRRENCGRSGVCKLLSNSDETKSKYS
jgi:hypothetical protein